MHEKKQVEYRGVSGSGMWSRIAKLSWRIGVLRSSNPAPGMQGMQKRLADAATAALELAIIWVVGG